VIKNFVVRIVGRSNSLNLSCDLVYKVRKVSTYLCCFDALGAIVSCFKLLYVLVVRHDLSPIRLTHWLRTTCVCSTGVYYVQV
jgi:hypothetical protein